MWAYSDSADLWESRFLSVDPTGTARQRWSNRCKAAFNAFEITFDGRLSAGRN